MLLSSLLQPHCKLLDFQVGHLNAISDGHSRTGISFSCISHLCSRSSDIYHIRHAIIYGVFQLLWDYFNCLSAIGINVASNTNRVAVYSKYVRILFPFCCSDGFLMLFLSKASILTSYVTVYNIYHYIESASLSSDQRVLMSTIFIMPVDIVDKAIYI